ncbi:hypothetical protein Lalb_Chr22g0352361 [Lupinus albus]|uniref:Myb/SANT-like DNA-binding domain-containing protein n=1 Tax=Lupinus albus TaxID=3870 RepID=A0A6A4NE91_LUPAL|nr:hypothetical protein Lalb_Chr22g0352361 [Lupinus albus]
MNSSGLGGGFLSGSSGGILDLESPFHRHQHSQLGHPSVTSQQQHINILGGLENDHQIGLTEAKCSNAGLSFGKGKGIAASNPANSNDFSEEDEAEDGNCDNFDGGKGKKGSPWQRMKWTDNMVRLLVAVVCCVGDDGTINGMDGHKRKSMVLQKKGKWKTVSKIMISKGCHVSPQQCEDKFNDMNKRYKRLNDILGRGTCCQVVENPALMDSMPKLSTKAKDDVRKILSSKHLFYKEMCAYHNGKGIPNCQDLDLQGYSLEHGRDSRDNNGSDEEAEDNNDSEDDELNEDGGKMEFYGRNKLSEDDDRFLSLSVTVDKFEAEMARIFQDPSKPLLEQKEWIMMQSLKLQEQKVSYEAQALELEKQRFKWLRYCSKKDRELERLRLENERMKLENEQKILKLKLKEHEADFSRTDMSLDPVSLGINRPQGREHINLGRQQ